MAQREWRIRKPEKPKPPCRTATELLKQCCADWGLDYQRFAHSRRPCVPCHGGSLVTDKPCPYCGGAGEGNIYAWRAFYQMVCSEYRDQLRAWERLMEIHMRIKNRLNPRERDYIGIE